ncbi:MAG TPA: hypothetical protein VKB65_11145, partial [Myxococcota bacterium]|nr:hypothetical protein [Myxococcota bacterium]
MDFALDAALGAVLGAGFVALARRAGRAELAWIAAGLLVAAAIYPLLGLAAHGARELRVELFGVALFGGLAGLGLVLTPWLLAAGWLLHAAWDLLLPWVADTGYVPPWYGAACLGFDLVVVAALAVRALRG